MNSPEHHSHRNIFALLHTNRVVEIRAMNATSKKIIRGYFDDLDKIIAVSRKYSGQYNMYTSLNRPFVDITADNKMINGRPGSSLSDSDIEVITRLPFDFDPERPSGVSSTSGELIAAHEAHNELKSYLGARDWAEPLRGMSGNGYHLQYRVHLPNTAETKEALRFIYLGLQSRFSDEAVKFDPTVRSAGQIFRMYGTKNLKGKPTADRPHRDASCYVPLTWRAVSRKQVMSLAEQLRPKVEEVRRATTTTKPSGPGNYRTLDIVTWFRAHGLYKRDLTPGKHAVRCPWHAQHSTQDEAMGSDTVIWEGDGSKYPSFFCSHNSCHGQRLFDVIDEIGSADDYCAEAFGGAS